MRQTVRRILILQHPQERDALLGSAQIAAASLPKAKLVVGLSWRNLGHALGEEGIDAKKWAVLFPEREDLAPNEGSAGASERAKATTRSGVVLDPAALEGLVVLDGTWSKAKTLWWRNPWLNKMNRMTLVPSKPSIYGRLRAEPRREYVSTLESVAQALTACGEAPDIQADLERTFRTLVQRVRDARLIPPPARRSPQRADTRAPRASATRAVKSPSGKR